MSGTTHHRTPDGDTEGRPRPGFAVQSWRRIVRMMLADPRLAPLPCRNDLLLVAYDFAALCDVSGRGCYSSKERTGRALEDRPDPSLCELAEISKMQVSRMLRLLISLGALRQTRRAAMGRQAEYQAAIPTGSEEEIGECLAMAAELGFKPRTRRDMSRQSEARRHRQSYAEALNVLAGSTETDPDGPVDNPVGGVMRTTPTGGHVYDPSEGRMHDPQGGRVDDPPLPIGVLGNKGTTGSTTSAGPGSLLTGARKDHQRVAEEEPEQPRRPERETVDGGPAANRWGGAVTQAAIRQTGLERAKADRAGADRCPGLDGDGCAWERPVSPGSQRGLCLRCEGLRVNRLALAAPEDAGLSFDAPPLPPPSYDTDPGEIS